MKTDHLISVFAKLSEQWTNPRTAWRRDALQALCVSTGYTLDQVERAVDAAFNELSTTAMQHIVAGFSSAREVPKKRVLHIAAGNVFTAWLHGVVLTLLLAHQVRLKPSSQETVFPNRWLDTLSALDASLARDVEIVPWSDSIGIGVDHIVAYGNDETLQSLKQKFPILPFTDYGHKLSVAIIFSEAMDDHWPLWQEKIRQDMAAFDLQGCLSPRILYMQRGTESISREHAAEVHHPEVRFFNDPSELRREIGGFREKLSCVGYAGRPQRASDIREILERAGDVRVCPLGDMQRPALSWRNGGKSLIDELGCARGRIGRDGRQA